MYRCNQVNEQVSGDSAGIVPVLAIAEDAFRVVLAARRIAQPLLPVKIHALLQVRGDGIVPCARGAIPIVGGDDLGDLAELAGRDDFPRFLLQERGAPLTARLQDTVVSPDGLDHFRTIFDPMGHGFFNINVLACSKRIQDHGQMLVVRWRENDGVDILAFQE